MTAFPPDFERVKNYRRVEKPPRVLPEFSRRNC
jgi:hypothetical protein